MSMAGFLSNSKVFEVQANNQVAALLAEFDSGYVMGVVEDTLNQLFNHFDLIPRPNIVQSFETIFKEMNNTYPSDLDNINQCRIETYQTIIGFICKKFELRFVQPENVDLHTLAFFLYDFFVARLNIYMVQFYVKHILNEKESIINMLNMEEIMKNQDANFNYNRMAFGNDEMAAIASNIPFILQKLSQVPVMDHQILWYTYGQQPEIVQMIENAITPSVPIFNRFNAILFNEALYGPIVTNIRIQFQQTAAVAEVTPQMLQNMK